MAHFSLTRPGTGCAAPVSCGPGWTSLARRNVPARVNRARDNPDANGLLDKPPPTSYKKWSSSAGGSSNGRTADSGSAYPGSNPGPPASSRHHSPVAQLVERVAVNHLVGGSSPSRGARKKQGVSSSRANPFFLRCPYWCPGLPIFSCQGLLGNPGAEP